MNSRKRIKTTQNLVKVMELEKRESGKVWAKLECGHARILDGNTLNQSKLKCLECSKPLPVPKNISGVLAI